MLSKDYIFIHAWEKILSLDEAGGKVLVSTYKLKYGENISQVFLYIPTLPPPPPPPLSGTQNANAAVGQVPVHVYISTVDAEKVL